ncbi:glucan biosynthesis protein D [Sphingomonas sp. Root710]|nr:glucan biosynthesis protein D [Sphingomonas sp. Root710]
MIDRRQSIALLGALLAFGGNALAAAPRKAGGAGGAGQPFSWDWLRAHAATLARGPARPLPQPDSRAHAVDYDAANRISFRSDRAIFPDDGYAVRLFPLGRYAAAPVAISVVENGRARLIEHSEDMFAVAAGNGPAPAIVPGVSGFRVMNKGGVGDWLAFQGASYFRSAGALHQYGLSARGLAIDTGIDGREEFPVFTSFWLERGAESGAGLTVYALLEGPSVTGAYRFVNRDHSGGKAGQGEIVQDVSMALYLRRDVERLGIAPLTSMFWYDEGNPAQRIDWRPEIHDSDGLLIHNRAGERIWRPLGNPPRATINSFADSKGASAFGLFQRDRAFDHYQDDGVFYEKRPSLWVEPRGDWGPGAVMLYEIPTSRETDDNIVAFWTPARPARAGSSFAFDYRLRWIAGEPDAPKLARVVERWTGTAGRPGTDPIPNARRLVADFEGPSLKGYDRGSGVTASVTLDRGKLLSVDCYPVVGRPNRWRLIVDATRTDAPANLRATLERGDVPLSETLIHQFYGAGA